MNVLKLLGANAVSASALTLAFRSSATSNAATVTAPSDIVAGDLLVLYDRASQTGFPTAVTPTGFTQILNQTGGTAQRFVCSYKIAAGTEAGTSITGMDGATNDTKILLVFSTGGATTASAFDVAFEQTDGDPAAQTVNASGGSPSLIVIAFVRQEATTGQSFSPTQDAIITFGTSRAYYKIYNSSPADVTVDCQDNGAANALMSFYIEVD